MREAIKKVLAIAAKHPDDADLLLFVELMVGYDRISSPEFQWIDGAISEVRHRLFVHRLVKQYASHALKCMESNCAERGRLRGEQLAAFMAKLEVVFAELTEALDHTGSLVVRDFFESDVYVQRYLANDSIKKTVKRVVLPDRSYDDPVEAVACRKYLAINHRGANLPPSLVRDRLANYDAVRALLKEEVRGFAAFYKEKIRKYLDDRISVVRLRDWLTKQSADAEQACDALQKEEGCLEAVLAMLKKTWDAENTSRFSELSFCVGKMHRRSEVRGDLVLKACYELLCRAIDPDLSQDEGSRQRALIKALTAYRIAPTETYDGSESLPEAACYVAPWVSARRGQVVLPAGFSFEQEGSTLFHLAVIHGHKRLLASLLGPRSPSIWESTFESSSRVVYMRFLGNIAPVMELPVAMRPHELREGCDGLTQFAFEEKVREFLLNQWSMHESGDHYWAHPFALHAYAALTKVPLYMWMVDPLGGDHLVPYQRDGHGDSYACTRPTAPKGKRIDLLMVGDGLDRFRLFTQKIGDTFPKISEVERLGADPMGEQQGYKCHVSLLAKIKASATGRSAWQKVKSRMKQECQEGIGDRIENRLELFYEQRRSELWSLKNTEGKAMSDLRGPGGNTPLHYLLGMGLFSFARGLIVDAGANPTVANNAGLQANEIYNDRGHALVHQALFVGDLGFVSYLCCKGYADANMKTRGVGGETPKALIELIEIAISRMPNPGQGFCRLDRESEVYKKIFEPMVNQSRAHHRVHLAYLREKEAAEHLQGDSRRKKLEQIERIYDERYRTFPCPTEMGHGAQLRMPSGFELDVGDWVDRANEQYGAYLELSDDSFLDRVKKRWRGRWGEERLVHALLDAVKLRAYMGMIKGDDYALYCLLRESDLKILPQHFERSVIACSSRAGCDAEYGYQIVGADEANAKAEAAIERAEQQTREAEAAIERAEQQTREAETAIERSEQDRQEKEAALLRIAELEEDMARVLEAQKARQKQESEKTEPTAVSSQADHASARDEASLPDTSSVIEAWQSAACAEEVRTVSLELTDLGHMIMGAMGDLQCPVLLLSWYQREQAACMGLRYGLFGSRSAANPCRAIVPYGQGFGHAQLKTKGENYDAKSVDTSWFDVAPSSEGGDGSWVDLKGVMP